jgi:hypothetical protein
MMGAIFSRMMGDISPTRGAYFQGNMASPGKFAPLENIVYFIAISSEIVRVFLKPRS